MRRVAAALFVVLLFALAIARLRRVARPRFEPVARFADGRIELGRVVLARPGQPGRSLGWSITCDRREVLSRLGDEPLPAVRAEADGVAVPALRVHVSSGDCSVSPQPTPAEIPPTSRAR